METVIRVGKGKLPFEVLLSYVWTKTWGRGTSRVHLQIIFTQFAYLQTVVSFGMSTVRWWGNGTSSTPTNEITRVDEWRDILLMRRVSNRTLTPPTKDGVTVRTSTLNETDYLTLTLILSSVQTRRESRQGTETRRRTRKGKGFSYVIGLIFYEKTVHRVLLFCNSLPRWYKWNVESYTDSNFDNNDIRLF